MNLLLSGEIMTKIIQIGTMALRAPDGSFLPSQPIYREVTVPDEEENTDKPDVGEFDDFDLYMISEMFYKKYKAFKKAQEAQKKEAERRKNENQTDEHLPVLRAGDQT